MYQKVIKKETNFKKNMQLLWRDLLIKIFIHAIIILLNVSCCYAFLLYNFFVFLI